MQGVLKALGSTFVSLTECGFIYGIQGVLLRRNFEKYWYQRCITKSSYNVFYLSSLSINQSINDLCQMGLNNVPFGFAQLDYIKNTWNESFSPDTIKNIQHKIATVTTLYDINQEAHNIKDFFYTKQRERKSWWRKISQNPSIYYLSEVKKEKGTEFVDLEAQFPFGKITVERIFYKKNGNKVVPGFSSDQNLNVVEYITSIDWGCVALLCDAYVEIDGSKELQLYPQLSPYKAYFKLGTSPDDEQVKSDLIDLSAYLNGLLREKNIETIIIDKNINNQVLHVPFIILVNSDSLKTGIVKVINQRTLVGESVHVTQLVNHIYRHCS